MVKRSLKLKDGNFVGVQVVDGLVQLKPNTNWIRSNVPVREWFTITSSSDGKYVFAIDNIGEIGVSIDYGLTFTLVSGYSMGNSPWGLKCSSSGQYVITCSAQSVCVSNDYGTTFTEIASLDPGNDTMGVCCSDSGQYMYVLTRARVYKSSNYGVSFSNIVGSPANASNIDCDSSGEWLLVTTNYALHKVYRSTNFGVAWSDLGVVAGVGTWRDISIRRTASHDLVVLSGGGTAFVDYDLLILSQDFGTTWSIVDNGTFRSVRTCRTGKSISSETGLLKILESSNNFSTSDQISLPSLTLFSGNSLHLSGDGSKMILGDFGGGIWVKSE